MRIAQVVTLMSPDGAYGGPVRVALNQLHALKALGHDVTLFSTHRGYQTPPTDIDGVTVVSYPARTTIPKVGFAGLASPALMARLRSDLSTFDIIHVHLARDLVTLPAAWLAHRKGVPLVVQTHGMIDRSLNLLAGPLDAVLTRPVLQSASTIFYLTDKEKGDLVEVSRGCVNLTHLINGVPRAGAVARREAPFEVLFLARLHPRKRATHFVRAALQLAPQFPNVRFTLVGPDEGDGPSVRDLIERSGSRSVQWEGALPLGATLKRMARASIYVLPSVSEPFPMSVLEAASLGLPVIVTETCGLASSIESYEAGEVIGDSVIQLAGALRRLLSDHELLAARGMRAEIMANELFGMHGVTDILTEQYQIAIARSRPQ